MAGPDFPVLIALEESTSIAASPSVLWPLVADPAQHGRWSDELVEARWIDSDEPVVGARFAGLNRIEGFGEWITEPLEWTTYSTVVTAEVDRSFAWLVGDQDDPVSWWGFELRERPNGTELVQRVKVHPRGLAFTIGNNPDEEAEVIKSRGEALSMSMGVTLTRIKAHAERGDQMTA